MQSNSLSMKNKNKIDDASIIEFAQENGKPTLDMVKAFVAYEPSITGDELQKQGFSGQGLGHELNRREAEMFKAYLS